LNDEVRPLLEAAKGELQARRDWLFPQLQRLGFELPVMPEGAFYIYAGIPPAWGSVESVADRWLREVGVAVTPGPDFGLHAADRYVRFAYTTGLERIREGVGRLEGCLS
jgi:aspartate/methionine/tyrosine aminotransferase